MKTTIRAIILGMLLLITASCMTVPGETKIIEIPAPKIQPLPHSEVPKLELPEEGEIPLEEVMLHVLLLDGEVEKLQVLIEIYEREYCELPEGYSNKKYSDKTLTELKLEYYALLGITPDEPIEE